LKLFNDCANTFIITKCHFNLPFIEKSVTLSRLLRLRGRLSEEAIAQLNQALLIALDLPGQDDEIFLNLD